ncbi:hypothetical protein R5R35_000753 [Gryllus longicercus]|uniref:Carboxylic ester hydrolase n=1 Tax=Gryllus longicercus TaxID=2509291 RepID=A0AAN9ZB11_9ORTH
MSGYMTVSLRQGALRGRRLKTPAGNVFFSFQGLPYAKPPLGELRYKAPEPAGSWTGIRDATKLGNQCVHFDPLTQQLVGDEDCLFLNVYTPQLPLGRGVHRPLAVLFWIHGGGFSSGSSNMYGPEPLMDQDVVLVTINYRLGPLGFLSLDSPEVPGNAGMKDMVMALRWVKDNIASFGGDPENVTIFGESAGGAAVHYLVLSPLANGLFRRAIAQSGSALCPWAFSKDPVGRAKRLAVAAGCASSSVEEPEALLRWFREASPVALVKASLDGTATAEERRRGDLTLFVPCVEATREGAFLLEEPAALLASGDVPKVPIVFGLTSHEGILTLGIIEGKLGGPKSPNPSGMSPLEEIASDMERLLPADLLKGKRDLQRSRQLVERLKDFYLGGRQLADDTLDGFVDLLTDINFSVGVIRAARGHARHGAPVFMYEFGFRGRLNFLGQVLGAKVQGVCHADELGYQFAIPGLSEPDEGSAEAVVRRRMGRLWTQFAQCGNPTPTQDDVITTTWLPYSELSPNYLFIGEDLKQETGLWKERVQFWTDIYKM